MQDRSACAAPGQRFLMALRKCRPPGANAAAGSALSAGAGRQDDRRRTMSNPSVYANENDLYSICMQVPMATGPTPDADAADGAACIGVSGGAPWVRRPHDSVTATDASSSHSGVDGMRLLCRASVWVGQDLRQRPAPGGSPVPSSPGKVPLECAVDAPDRALGAQPAERMRVRQQPAQLSVCTLSAPSIFMDK